ncbi:MAG: hypothetical protein ACYDH9_16565 [Limisphaerales bacterium]
MKTTLQQFAVPAAAILLALAGTASAAITGQWDFKNGDLTATIGQPLNYLDTDTQTGTQFGTTTGFAIPGIAGQTVTVMKFPATTSTSGGYDVPTGAVANGGGSLINQWTIIMDVYYPPASSGVMRALIHRSDLMGNPEFSIDAANEIGFDGGAFNGNLSTNGWHRIAFAVDTAGTISSYLDGVKVGDEATPGGLDGRFALTQDFYLFNGDTNQTALGYIGSLQVRDEKLSDGLIAALGGPSTNGILTGLPPNPYTVSLSPSPDSARFPGRSTVSPQPTISIVLADGQAKVVTNTVQLQVDSQVVIPSITTTGATTVVSYTPTNFLASQSLHSVALAYKDDAVPADSLGVQWQFVVGPYVGLPADAALPSGSGSTPGFIVRTVQAPAAPLLPNVFLRAIKQLDGTLTDASGAVVTNAATPNPATADGSYPIDTVIDFASDGNPFGSFTQTTLFPGIPGADDPNNLDNFSVEAVAYLQLSAGTHTFGMNVGIDRVDLTDDDGYELFVGKNPRSFFSTLVGQFARTGDNFNDRHNDNLFTFLAPTDGLYPFRLVYWQTDHGANLEWYSVDPVTGDKILINDATDARSVKAFRVSTVPRPAYVAEMSPQPGTAGNPASAPIVIVLSDDGTQVNPNSIQLSVNGIPVTPALAKIANQTTVTYQPDPGRTLVTNTVHLVYRDTASPAPNSFTNDWQFAIQVSASGNLAVVTGQWDFERGDLSATIGKPLQYFDGPTGQTATKTKFGTTTSFGIPDINGQPAHVMEVPGDISNQLGYIMDHGIAPNGGGKLVNQYTLTMDILISGTGSAASIIQIQSTNNTTDGSLFWQGNNMGQGQGGYNGKGTFTRGAWHRATFAVDLALNPPLITKYVDGIKQDDWVQSGLDLPRRSLQPTAVLFGDGDGDDRSLLYVKSIQIRSGKLSDAQLAELGGPSAYGVPVSLPQSTVAGQWDFERGDLSATVGKDLQYFDGPTGQTATKTKFGTTTSFGIPDINGQPANVMEVPGDISNQLGYIMDHGIAPNGGGKLVNQYTLTMDILVSGTGGAASIIQIQSTNNTTDGSLFWQGNNMGQGQGGYVGLGTFTRGAWHRATFAVDLALNPPLITKYVDGIKQDDWVQSGLDLPRRSLQPTAVLFGDGDGDDRSLLYVKSIQIRPGKLSDAQLAELGGPSASGIPLAVPDSNVTGQWDFERGDLSATIGKPLQYFDGATGQTATKTKFGTTTSFGVPDINGQPANIMEVPGDISNQLGYIMDHGIAPNGGGKLVNQYTLTMDILIGGTGSAASIIQIQSTNNTTDGSLFWQGNNMGQGQGGYNGKGTFTRGAWHRATFAVDLTLNPPLITKYVDGVKQDDWVQTGLDLPRRSLQPTAVLFGDGDGDDRSLLYVKSIQIRSGKLSDAQLAELGGPSASGIPVDVPASNVTGQWDFQQGDLSATVGKDLQYFDGPAGQTATKTKFGTTTSFGIPDINGQSANVMEVPGDISNQLGYIMDHGIAPNGGGKLVNQYTLTMDILISGTGSAASIIQIQSTNNTTDGSLFWQDNNMGQGQGGYVGLGTFTRGAWHRATFAVDLALNPPLITKYVDGIKQDDWVQTGFDLPRRSLQPTAVLFGDGDGDDRTLLYVRGIQIRSGKLSDADLVALGGPSATGIPIVPTAPTAPVAPAKLVISLTGNNVTISWPQALSGFTLESTDNLTTPSWGPVQGVTTNSAVIPLGGGAKFYRLHK